MSSTYNFEDGKVWNGTYDTSGIVHAANLSCYIHPGNGVCPGNSIMGQEVHQGLAHNYGEQVRGTECLPYEDISDVLNSGQNPPYFCRRTPNNQEFAYRFLEYNPEDTQKAYPAFTNWTITASAGRCNHYSQVGSPVLVDDINGYRAALNYTFKNENGSYTSSIQIPLANSAFMSTTYIYRGIHIPQKAETHRCGLRCISMWAYLSEKGTGGSFFECPITISTVNNTSPDSVHAVSNDLALIAAASIGPQSRNSDHDGVSRWTQYQFYPFG